MTQAPSPRAIYEGAAIAYSEARHARMPMFVLAKLRQEMTDALAKCDAPITAIEGN